MKVQSAGFKLPPAAHRAYANAVNPFCDIDIIRVISRITCRAEPYELRPRPARREKRGAPRDELRIITLQSILRCVLVRADQMRERSDAEFYPFIQCYRCCHARAPDQGRGLDVSDRRPVARLGTFAKPWQSLCCIKTLGFATSQHVVFSSLFR